MSDNESIEDTLKRLGITPSPKTTYTKVKTENGYIIKGSSSEIKTGK